MVTAARAGDPSAHISGPHANGSLKPSAAPSSIPSHANHVSKGPPAPWMAPRPLPRGFVTPRLALRFWQEDDADDLLAAINEDRDSLLPWLSCFRADYHTIGQCHFHIDRFRRQHQSPDAREYILGAFDRETGAVVGGTGFYQLDRPSHSAEIGYWVRPSRRGEGLAAEMARGLLSWAFTPSGAGGWGLRRLEVFCSGHNVASSHIPRSLGLRQEYIARAARWMDGFGWDDTLGWGVTVDEWDPRAQALRGRASKSNAGNLDRPGA